MDENECLSESNKIKKLIHDVIATGEHNTVATLNALLFSLIDVYGHLFTLVGYEVFDHFDENLKQTKEFLKDKIENRKVH